MLLSCLPWRVMTAVDTLEVKFGEEGVRSISGIISATILYEPFSSSSHLISVLIDILGL